jgi:hypothetical protein
MSDPSESQSNFAASMNGLQATLDEAIVAGQATYNHLGAPINDKVASTIAPLAPCAQAMQLWKHDS